MVNPSYVGQINTGVHLRAVKRENQDVFLDALASLRMLLAELGMKPPIAVAHRIVHGGAAFRHSVIVNDEVLKQIEQLKSTRAFASATQYRWSTRFHCRICWCSAGRLFRHSLSCECAADQSGIRTASRTDRQRYSTVWLSWAVLPVHHSAYCSSIVNAHADEY
jgi:hypothetical protein